MSTKTLYAEKSVTITSEIERMVHEKWKGAEFLVWTCPFRDGIRVTVHQVIGPKQFFPLASATEDSVEGNAYEIAERLWSRLANRIRDRVTVGRKS